MRIGTGLLRSEVFLIGLIVHHWSYLEYSVELLIWEILQIDAQTGRAITSDIQLRARMKMLRKLIDARHSPMSQVIGDLETTIHTLETDRNLIAHGIWGRNDTLLKNEFLVGTAGSINRTGTFRWYYGVPPEGRPFMDQRGSRRRRVLKTGTIEFGGGAFSCSIRDASDTGAMLDLPNPFGIPDHFVLATDGSRFACRIIWRKATRIGIAFE